jgi:hypothetical protein
VQAPADELSSLSPEFAALWRDNDMRSYGEGNKTCTIQTSGGSRWNIRPSLSKAAAIVVW